MPVKSKRERDLQRKNVVSEWEMFGIPIFGGGESQVLKKVGEWLASGEKNKWIATVNPEFVMKAVNNKDFMEILGKTNLNVADGIGLIWAREVKVCKVHKFCKGAERVFCGIKVGVEILFGKHKEGLVPGADLMKKMCELDVGRKLKVFFLGGWGDRAERTAKNLKGESLKLEVEWSEGEPVASNAVVIEQINKFKPDLLFVAYGMQKQEEWVYNNLKKLDIGVAMGVGRSFDYYSGDLKRAPNWVRKMGMEWLYSLIVEPKRWKRQLVLPKFVWKVINS